MIEIPTLVFVAFLLASFIFGYVSHHAIYCAHVKPKGRTE